MLVELRIENILLMDKLSIRFNGGFTAITGQTGAGKSILLDSLGIILGDRAGAGILRDSTKHGVIVATFESSSKNLSQTLYDGGFIENINENFEVIIKKIITTNGSRIFINDIQTTVNFINSIAGELLEIYSQFEQTDLFSVKKHLSILDDFGGFGVELKTLKTKYDEMVDTKSIYDRTKLDIENQKQNLEYLQEFIDDMNALKLQDGEYEELTNKRRMMNNSEKIATYIDKSSEELQNLKIGVAVSRVQDNLQHLNNEENKGFENSVNAINELLENMYNSYQSAVDEVENIRNSINFDEDEFNRIEDRISAINEISRKYKTTPIELLDQYSKANEKVQKISFSDKILGELLEKYNAKKEEYLSTAKDLSNKRHECANRLEKIVISKLANLKMDKVVFFTQFEEIEPTESGIDKIVFFASMNQGMKPAPIHKIASGGELSRFMLAFKSALCAQKNTQTIIFDEIDTGVGGSVAYAIGVELKNLAKTSQVICITHNAQTAACAENHIFVEKKQSLKDTTTIAKTLGQEERIKAIAEMISLDEITEEAIMQAKKLLGYN